MSDERGQTNDGTGDNLDVLHEVFEDVVGTARLTYNFAEIMLRFWYEVDMFLFWNAETSPPGDTLKIELPRLHSHIIDELASSMLKTHEAAYTDVVLSDMSRYFNVKHAMLTGIKLGADDSNPLHPLVVSIERSTLLNILKIIDEEMSESPQ